MIEFAVITANCLWNNLWKFGEQILSCTENNHTYLAGSFLLAHAVLLASQRPINANALASYIRQLFTLTLTLPVNPNPIKHTLVINGNVKYTMTIGVNERMRLHVRSIGIYPSYRHHEYAWCLRYPYLSPARRTMSTRPFSDHGVISSTHCLLWSPYRLMPGIVTSIISFSSLVTTWRKRSFR